jgi:23S rRNA (adenine2503-C2)-methyltransferase
MPMLLHELSYDELIALVVQDGLRSAHGITLWNALQYRAVTDLNSCTHFLPPLKRWIEAHVGTPDGHTLDVLPVASHVPSEDGLTQKFLLRLHDGQVIETVVMGYKGRHTACISTQAGCAMGCVFCATGQMGFVRHLRPGEIVAQVQHARRILNERGERLRNLVLMGMGEPLHNYDSVMKAMDLISDTRGANIGPSKISISTVAPNFGTEVTQEMVGTHINTRKGYQTVRIS